MKRVRSLPNLFKKWYVAWGQRENQALFDRLSKAQSLRPTLTLTMLLAFVLTLLVHGCSLVTALAGGFAAIELRQSPFMVLFGLVFVYMGWLLRPKLGRLPKERLSRQKFPILFNLVDTVAASLHTPSVEAIVVNEQFNASYHRVGWRQKSVLTLGLPLWLLLDDQERVALVAHELAHAVNGDFSRRLLVSAACNTLIEWHGLLSPPQVVRYRRRLEEEFAKIVSALLSLIPLWLFYGLRLLLWHESRRAEYLADYLATSTSGTDAMLGMLGKLEFRQGVSLAVHRMALSGSQNLDLFEELQRQTDGVTLDTLERSSQTRRTDDARLDTTHPPIANRIAFLKGKPIVQAKVTISAEDSRLLEGELATLKKDIQAKLLDMHDAMLYR